YMRGRSGEKYIFLRGGEYYIKSPVRMYSNDKNITICGYGEEKVKISASKSVPYSAFKRVTDENILNRIIEKSGRDAVMQVYLPDIGITDYGTMYAGGFTVWDGNGTVPELTYNGKLMSYAAYPNPGSSDNGGYVYTADVKNDISFSCNDERIKKYAGNKDLWVLGWFIYDWAENTTSVSFDNGYFTINTIPAGSGFNKILKNRRVRFLNVLEELDIPGEFYLDRSTGILYIIPPEGIKAGDELRFSPDSTTLFSGSKSADITFRNLIFEGTRSRAVDFADSARIKIDGCEFYGIGEIAACFTRCTESGAENSYFHDIDGSCVEFDVCGDRKNLVSSECYVQNCRFERFSQYRKTMFPAISIGKTVGAGSGGCGFLISHNYFEDGPYCAIKNETNDCIIEYNEINNVCNDTSDSGAIYSGRDWSTQGNEIRYNYFHNITQINSASGYDVQAVYLDDCHSSTKVYKNIFYKCPSPALFGGGRYNTFENNMIFECKKPFVMDARGEVWDDGWLDENNSSSLYAKLKAFDYKNGVWAERYPYLVNILEDEPKVPKHNTIKNNLEYRSGGFNIHDDVVKYGDVANNTAIFSTSCLEDYAAGDFRIKDISKIKSRIPEFEYIPFDKMGTQLTETHPRPSVTVEKLSGTAKFYDTLHLNYSSKSDGCEIADIIIRWYTVTNGQRIEIKGENSGALELSEDFAGKTVTASVTPIDLNGTLGYTMWAGNVSIEKISYSDAVSAEKTADGLKITNTSGGSLGVFVFGANYTENGGYKTMTALEFLGISAGENEDINITGNSVFVTSGKTLEPITVK
ncbi:MAG: right-handed parallel beta-helix repeat-containing protein, partial [Clostridia bacterium]|nr:right-handed parallel beta-helix repeat-containing protein [Clostridia bacterium]